MVSNDMSSTHLPMAQIDLEQSRVSVSESSENINSPTKDHKSLDTAVTTRGTVIMIELESIDKGVYDAGSTRKKMFDTTAASPQGTIITNKAKNYLWEQVPNTKEKSKHQRPPTPKSILIN